MYVCILCQLSVCRLSESEANRARRLLVIKCSVLLLNQKPNARILFRTATKLTLPLLLRMALLLPLSLFAATTSTSSAVCVCLQVTNTKSTSSSSQPYVLPFLSLPASYTALSAHQYMHERIHCIYFLPSSHSRGSFVIKLAGTTSQLTATKSWHSGANQYLFVPSRNCNGEINVERKIALDWQPYIYFFGVRGVWQRRFLFLYFHR